MSVYLQDLGAGVTKRKQQLVLPSRYFLESAKYFSSAI